MSRKWFIALLIASTLALIIVISLKVGPALVVQFSASNDQSTSTISPNPASNEEGPSTNRARTTSDVQSMPLETTRIQEQPSADEERPSEEIQLSPVNFSAFENASRGVWIQYPSNWEVVDGGEDNDGVIEIAGFVSPFEDRFDTYKERLWLSLDNLPEENMTLQEYSNEVTKLNNQSLREFQLLDQDTESTILAGHPAYRFIHTRSLDDGTLIKQMEIGTKMGNKVYYLDYYAEDEKYDEFLPVIQDMINSLKIRR